MPDDTPTPVGDGGIVTADSTIDPAAPANAVLCRIDPATRRIWAYGIRIQRPVAEWLAATEGYRVPRGLPAVLCYRTDPSWASSDRGGIIGGRTLRYLGYLPNLIFSAAPVNQMTHLPLWQDYCGRFAHQLDALHGSRSMTGLSRGRRQVVVDYLDARVGNMWQLLTSWAAIDPKTDNSWEAARPSIQQAIEDLCATCDSPMWPITIAKNIETRPFQLALDEGRVPAIDNSVTPWVPGRTLDSVKLTALTTDLERIQAIGGFRESLRAGHAGALAHFEIHGEHVAAHDHGPSDDDDN